MLPCVCQPPRSLGSSREEEKKKRSEPQASGGVLDFPPPSQQPAAPGALLSPSSILQNPNTHLGPCLGARRCEIHPPAAAQQMPRRFGDLSWLQGQGQPRRKVLRLSGASTGTDLLSVCSRSLKDSCDELKTRTSQPSPKATQSHQLSNSPRWSFVHWDGPALTLLEHCLAVRPQFVPLFRN